jgi:hypothetical protein
MPPILTPAIGRGICADLARCEPPPVSPVEAKRKQVYKELYSFGASSVPALARLLQSSDDVTAKRNALLPLNVLGGGFFFSFLNPSRIDTSAALPALGDSDATARVWG